MENTLIFTEYTEDQYTVAFATGKYHFGGGVYIAMEYFDEETNGWEYYCDVTVNFPDYPLEEDHAFIDIDNAPFLPHFLQEHKLAVPTGHEIRSGFCTYPEYSFAMETLGKYVRHAN